MLPPRHPRLLGVRALHEGRERRASGRFLIEGPTLLAEARRSGRIPLEIYVLASRAADPQVIASEDAGIPVFIVAEPAFARLSQLTTPSGIVAVMALPEQPLRALLAAPGDLVLLAGIADPGNAGTLVRSADAFGASGVIFGTGGVDPYADKVVRAAMGSLFRLPIALAQPDELVEAARATGRPIIATALEGEDLTRFTWPQRSIIAIGNERRGVADWLPHWDAAVRIAQSGAAESLNAGVAGSIVLHALAQQR